MTNKQDGLVSCKDRNGKHWKIESNHRSPRSFGNRLCTEQPENAHNLSLCQLHRMSIHADFKLSKNLRHARMAMNAKSGETRLRLSWKSYQLSPFPPPPPTRAVYNVWYLPTEKKLVSWPAFTSTKHPSFRTSKTPLSLGPSKLELFSLRRSPHPPWVCGLLSEYEELTTVLWRLFEFLWPSVGPV